MKSFFCKFSLAGTTLALLCAVAGMLPVKTLGQTLEWVDAKTLAIEGRAWAGESAHAYDRLPASARERVSPSIWRLAADSSGMAVAFVTNSNVLEARWTVRKPELARPHMAATGVSGLDLYIRDNGQWRWAAIGKPGNAGTEFSARLVGGLPKGERACLLYLPLYNGVESLEIGIVAGSHIRPLVREKKPIIFYGTSITQGACASRPGMTYPAMLGRRLDMPVVDLGFSGNGKMEPGALVDVAHIESAGVFVLDALPNMNATQIGRWAEMIAMIRQKHPTTPVVLVPSIQYANGWVNPGAKQRATDSTKALKELYAQLSPNDPNLYLVDEGDGMLGDDGEATVDGTHPNDIGHTRIADRIEATLRKALR